MWARLPRHRSTGQGRVPGEPLPCLCTRQAGVKRPNSRNMRFWSTLLRRVTPRGVVMGVVMSDADLGVRWRRSARSCSRRVGSELAVAIKPSVYVVAYARACIEW